MWEIYVGKPSKAEFSPLNKIADVLHDPLIFIPVLQMFLVQYNFPAFPLQKNVFTSNFFDLRCFPAAESKVCPTSQLCGKIFWSLLHLLSSPLPDLPESLACNVAHGSWRGSPLPGDVVCLIKRYICDSELSQAPLLILPHVRVGEVQLVPQPKKLRLTANQHRKSSNTSHTLTIESVFFHWSMPTKGCQQP